MRISTIALSIAFICCTSTIARAQATAPVDDLKKQLAADQAKLKESQGKLSAIRASIAKQDEVVALSKALATARKAMEEKIAADPKVVEARKAAAQASADLRKVTEEEMAASPDYAAAAKEAQTANDAEDDLMSQQRIANFILGEVRRKVSKDPDLKKLSADVASAEAAVRANPASEDAKKARAAAVKAYDEAVQAKVAANPEGAAQLKKLDEIKGKLAEAANQRKAADQKMAELRKTVSAKSEKIATARKAEETATKAVRDAMSAAGADERAAVDKAQKAYNDAVESKFNADQNATQLRKEIDDLNKEMRDLSAQIRKAAKQ